MYLVKFFHKSPGDDDRLLSLALQRRTLTGIHAKAIDFSALLLGNHGSSGLHPGEFLREKFETVAQSVAAFRREAEGLRAAGYVETHHTDPAQRELKGDFTPKPDWQRAVDEAVLSAFGDTRAAQAQCLDALEGTEAGALPVTLWLRTQVAGAAQSDDALERTLLARDTFLAYEAENRPHYTWSLSPLMVKAYILELLTQRYLEKRWLDPRAALDAISMSHAAWPDNHRLFLKAWIICAYFPEHEEDAYDSIYRLAPNFRIFDRIAVRPSYESYAARRAADARARRGSWRWSRSSPASEAEITEAESGLGVAFPENYRRFLSEHGQGDLFVRLPQIDETLRFFAPHELLRAREEFITFTTRGGNEARAAEVFLEEYGVALRHLIPVAEPRGVSNLMLLHAGPGDTYGHCFVWNHDGIWELVNEHVSLAATMDALFSGIERLDAAALDLLGVYIDEA